MVVALLSLIGVFIAFYLMAYSLGWMGSLVCGVSSCEAVQQSSYSKIGPIPVAAIGVAGYLILLVLSMMGLQPARRASRAIGGLLLAGAMAGVAFSAYLTWLEVAVIHAWCIWCATSATLITLIFIATLFEVSRIRGGERP
jgi:uncharacterized membrane protein